MLRARRESLALPAVSASTFASGWRRSGRAVEVSRGSAVMALCCVGVQRALSPHDGAAPWPAIAQWAPFAALDARQQVCAQRLAQSAAIELAARWLASRRRRLAARSV